MEENDYILLLIAVQTTITFDHQARQHSDNYLTVISFVCSSIYLFIPLFICRLHH